MMRESAVAEESCKHCKSAGGKRLVDERLLPVQRFDGGAAWQRIFTGLRIGDLRIKFTDGAQPVGLSPVTRIQRLTKDVLPARGVVAEIEPIGGGVECRCQRQRDGLPRAPRRNCGTGIVRLPRY